MNKCPFCAEEIQEEAIKFRYCAEFLDQKSIQEEPSSLFFNFISYLYTESLFMVSLFWAA